MSCNSIFYTFNSDKTSQASNSFVIGSKFYSHPTKREENFIISKILQYQTLKCDLCFPVAYVNVNI